VIVVVVRELHVLWLRVSVPVAATAAVAGGRLLLVPRSEVRVALVRLCTRGGGGGGGLGRRGLGGLARRSVNGVIRLGVRAVHVHVQMWGVDNGSSVGSTRRSRGGGILVRGTVPRGDGVGRG
jgi:hypothetical protein